MKTDGVRLLDHLTDEFARVERVAQQKRGRRFWPLGASPQALGVGLAITAVLASGAYAVPATRAALEDASGTFADWVAGRDDGAPGRALRPGDDAPTWVEASDKPTRLIAENAGVGLYVTRSELPGGEPYLEFSLGKDATILGATPDGWRQRFDEQAVVVLGPAPTRSGRDQEQGKFPLLGVVARSVASVELRYATGPELVSRSLDGGFVLMADATRPLSEIVAYDAGGREIDRIDLSDFQAPGR